MTDQTCELCGKTTKIDTGICNNCGKLMPQSKCGKCGHTAVAIFKPKVAGAIASSLGFTARRAGLIGALALPFFAQTGYSSKYANVLLRKVRFLRS